MSLWELSDLSTPWCVHVAATLRVADHLDGSRLMIGALAAHLRRQGVTRIDSACHRDNAGAWRFYQRLGFKPLDEERIAWLIGETA